MINIEIAEDYIHQVSSESLELAAQMSLKQQGASLDSGLTIVITDDDQLHQLNQKFLGIDTPTDVLAFPAGYTDPDTGGYYLGDVLISYPRGQAQAATSGHSTNEELQLLIVHGVLHLLGHDHREDDDKAQMWTAQGQILAQLGLSLINPPT
jgi:probable rRNA maturation factor